MMTARPIPRPLQMSMEFGIEEGGDLDSVLAEPLESNDDLDLPGL